MFLSTLVHAGNSGLNPGSKPAKGNQCREIIVREEWRVSQTFGTDEYAADLLLTTGATYLRPTRPDTSVQ